MKKADKRKGLRSKKEGGGNTFCVFGVGENNACLKGPIGGEFNLHGGRRVITVEKKKRAVLEKFHPSEGVIFPIREDASLLGNCSNLLTFIL